MRYDIAFVLLGCIILVPLSDMIGLDRWIFLHFHSAVQWLAELLQ
jgi:hypothetical protein